MNAILSPAGPAAPSRPRPIQLRTRGRRHGPITRLVSPSDLGESIKPFVFLDRVDVTASDALGFGFHPHSGIATLTLLIEGGFEYEDSTGASGTMSRGAVEWMQAGKGVWHRGGATGERIQGYQLWVALPPGLENAPPLSRYLDAQAFSTHGPARVILGELGEARSPIVAPSSMNYLEVQLLAGQVWSYDPPPGHDVAWVSVHKGRLRTPEAITAGELVVFAQGETPVTFIAAADSAFVLASAASHPHDLVMGEYSVHTSTEALRTGQAEIRRIAAELHRQGKLA